MNKKRVFKGIATALVTPLDENGINYPQFEKLIEWQIGSGINALVVAGTTGESSTLTDEEHRAAINFAVKTSKGRVPVIAGTGSNDTAYAIELSKAACEAGADALLVVTPYYNKATQKGLYKMYTEIAEASDKPIILYNVPSRTGVNIEPSTYEALAEHPNIVAIKEANGNISKIVETMAKVRGKLDLYSGNDDQIVPIMSLGGLGAISVLSNIAPRQTVEITDSFFNGDVEKSAKLQCDFHDLIDALFCEVNPIPVKAAVAEMGFCKNYLRMPLTEMDETKKANMIEIMKKHGLLK